MKFIQYTKYVYYSLYNNKTSQTYHGILDITLNKIILNINENIEVFIPYLNNSMLAITNESAYRICFIKDNDNDNYCLNGCPNDEIILNVDRNKCGNFCDPYQYLIIPEGVCSNECNNSVYTSNGIICGLCKDLNIANRYKLINGTKCLNGIIEGSEIYNPDLYLLKCSSGYILNDNNCILKCYKTCEECTEFSSDENAQKCIKCKEGYILNNSNCYINAFQDFKNLITKNNITSYSKSSNIINGQDFKALIYSSNNIVDHQMSIGTSSIDFGNCSNILKIHYNISEEENLIFIMVEIDYKKIDNDYISLNIGKKTLFNIFDSSGRKLDLSFCQDNIKLSHNISHIQEIDINSAKNFNKQNIDIFNSKDRFFNDLCHPYDNEEGKDIIIKDRRKDIYQNVTFCQVGCSYKGINYDLLTANCDCSNNLFLDIFSNITKEEEEKIRQDEIVNFETISKTFVSNLFIFNYDVIYCYNLIFDSNILKVNIGFYCFLILIIIQIILFIFFIYKKLTSNKIIHA